MGEIQNNGYRIDKLDALVEKLDAVLKKDSGKARMTKFWVSYAVAMFTLFGIVGGIFADYSGIKHDINGHIKNSEIHIGVNQKENIILNTNYRTDMSMDKLRTIFVSKESYENLKENVKTLEERVENVIKTSDKK